MDFRFKEDTETPLINLSLCCISRFLLLLLLLSLPTKVSATVEDYLYTSTGAEVTITAYLGPGGGVVVPDTIEGKPVTKIGALAFSYHSEITAITVPDSIERIGIYAFTGCANLRTASIGNGVTFMDDYVFAGCTSLTSVTIGGGITSIGNMAFNDCTVLSAIYFEGNAPSLGSWPFGRADLVTIFRLPAATGWGASFGERATVIWDPKILSEGPLFGFAEDQFGFAIASETDLKVAVQVSTDLANPEWFTLSTVTIENGSRYFADETSTDFPSGFYRLRMPRGE